MPSLSVVTLSSTALLKEVPPFSTSARVTVGEALAGVFLGEEKESKKKNKKKKKAVFFHDPGLPLRKNRALKVMAVCCRHYYLLIRQPQPAQHLNPLKVMKPFTRNLQLFSNHTVTLYSRKCKHHTG